MQAIARKTLPAQFRSVISPLYKRIQEGTVKPTKFPLDRKMRDRVLRSLVSVSDVDTDSKILPFPDVEELDMNWPPIKQMMLDLAPNNPRDKYFMWERIQERLDSGQAKISKELFLVWLAKNERPSRVLEIGCRTGKSLSALLKAHPQPNNCVSLLVDPFLEKGSPKVVRSNLKHLNIPTENVYTFVGFSEDVVPNLKAEFPDLKFDYVLVDGSHERNAARHDLGMITSLVAPGGYIVFDDIGSHGELGGYGLIDVWQEWAADNQGEFECHEYLMPWAFAVARRK